MATTIQDPSDTDDQPKVAPPDAISALFYFLQKNLDPSLMGQAETLIVPIWQHRHSSTRDRSSSTLYRPNNSKPKCYSTKI